MNSIYHGCDDYLCLCRYALTKELLDGFEDMRTFQPDLVTVGSPGHPSLEGTWLLDNERVTHSSIPSIFS